MCLGVTSSGESHDQSEPNSSAKAALKSSPPRRDRLFFQGIPMFRATRTSDVFLRTVDSGSHHLFRSRKAVTMHKRVRKEVDAVNGPCSVFLLTP